MTQSKIPPKITKQDFALPEGLSIRQATLLGVSILASVLVAFTVQGPLALRAFLAVLIAGTGLALAYKTIQGEHLETWLFRTLMFNLTNRRLLVWRRGAASASQPLEDTTLNRAPEPQRMPAPSVRWRRPVEPRVAHDLSFLGAMANVLIFAILAGLSVYMATGGAQQLLAYLDFVAGR
jgi:hypothetical protein